MLPYAKLGDFRTPTTCWPRFTSSSAVRAYQPLVWTVCASVSLLSARHLLVEQNVHYPLQLFFNQLIVFAILTFRPGHGFRYVQRIMRGEVQPWRSMSKGTALLGASACSMALSTLCILQSALHFYNLPVLAMMTIIALFAEDVFLYTTRAIPRTYSEIIRIVLLALAAAILLFTEYRKTIPNLAMSIGAMLFAGVARGLRKLAMIHDSDVITESVVQNSFYIVIGALLGLAWILVFETGRQFFTLEVGNIPLFALNAFTSAIAMFLGKSMLLPMHDETAETAMQVIDGPIDRVKDAFMLTLLTGIVGCYSALMMARSYTNIYQFCCFLLAMACVGGSAYAYASKTSNTYELLDAPSAPSAEDGDASLSSDNGHRPKMSPATSVFGKYLLGISTLTLWSAYGFLNFTERPDRPGQVLLDQAYVPHIPLEIVLSMYKEPIDEVRQLVSHLQSMPALHDAHVTIYIKDQQADNANIKQRTGAADVITLPNVGREGETFLNHILKRWDNLARQTIFLQAGIHNPREFYNHISNYYDRARTGFLSLGWPGRLCDCQNCGDRFGWEDNLHFIPKIYEQMYNTTNCEKILLGYKGQFIASAARIRGISKDVYNDIWQAFIDENSWAHQPEYLQGRPDSMSAPDFGYMVERLWNLLFQCNDKDVGWKCPTLVSGWRVGGDVSDCQCFDT